MRTSFGFALFGLGVIAALASAVPALSQTPSPQLSLVVDPLGEAFLTNDSSTEVRFQGYLITSTGKFLEPTTWGSISDQVGTNPRHVAAVLGQGALFFGEANPGPTSLAELNLMTGGLLAPGGQFGIGYPFVLPVGPNSRFLKFSYASMPHPTGIDAPIRILEPAPGGDLRLLVGADGSAWLENPGSSPVAFDGYQIGSTGGGLDPAGWMSIADYVAGGRADEIKDLLGLRSLGFQESSAAPRALTELTLNGFGMLRPNGRLELGKPFAVGQAPEAASFYYRLLGATQSQQGAVMSAPEPSSWLLAALAAVGAVALRRCRGCARRSWG